MKGPFYHPLDKLINDDKLFLLEAILPFVDNQMKAPLAMYIKISEMQRVMNGFKNYNYVNQCGLCRDISNQEDLLSVLANCGFSDIANQMSQFQSAMNMMHAMNMAEGNHFNFQNGDRSNRFQNIFDEYDNASDTDLERDTYSDYEANEPAHHPDDLYAYYNNPTDSSYPETENGAETDMYTNIMHILDEYDNSH